MGNLWSSITFCGMKTSHSGPGIYVWVRHVSTIPPAGTFLGITNLGSLTQITYEWNIMKESYITFYMNE